MLFFSSSQNSQAAMTNQMVFACGLIVVYLNNRNLHANSFLLNRRFFKRGGHPPGFCAQCLQGSGFGMIESA
jgi:hypothetical protein